MEKENINAASCRLSAVEDAKKHHDMAAEFWQRVTAGQLVP